MCSEPTEFEIALVLTLRAIAERIDRVWEEDGDRQMALEEVERMALAAIGNVES